MTTDTITPLPHWWSQCRKATFAEHVAECTTPSEFSDPARTPKPDTLAEATSDKLVCPLCGQSIQDGDRRVPWFSKTGGEVDERGASHLACPKPSGKT